MERLEGKGMTVLEEAAERKAQAEADAELARLQRHAFFKPLKNLRGTIDDASGLEHVAMGVVFDFLGVTPKRRERRLHAVLVEILRHFGWSAVFVQKDGKHTGLVRSFEREPVAQPVTPPAAPAATSPQEPQSVSAPVPGGPTIRLRGVDIPMTAEDKVFVQFVMDVARVVEQIRSADAVCESYQIEDWERDVVGNTLLDRFVRNACEMRIRSGDAPREFAQHTMPEGLREIKKLIGSERSAPRDKVAAVKIITDVAGSQGQVGVKSGFNIDISFGKDANGRERGLHLRDVTLYPRS
jgi:hypothetical protein